MILTIIESPFAPDKTRPEVFHAPQLEQNISYVRAALRDCLQRGEAPYASHALYTLPGVLDDSTPAERSTGMRAGFSWGSVGDLRAVYADLGVTSGMQAGIDRAVSDLQSVEIRHLPAWVASRAGKLPDVLGVPSGILAYAVAVPTGI